MVGRSRNAKNAHVAYIGGGFFGLKTWGPHIRFKDTPEGVFEATETIEFISYVLLEKSKIEKWPKSCF